NWAKQFQKDEVPENVETVDIPLSHVYAKEVEPVANPGAAYYPLFEFDKVKPGSTIPLLRLDKVVSAAGLSSSNSEAVRKLKEKAVRVNGNVVVVNLIAFQVPGAFDLRVGKQLKKIRITK